MHKLITTILLAAVCLTPVQAQDADDVYGETTRTVEQVDFDGMAAAYHKDAVLVSATGTKPIGDVMARWRREGEAGAAAGGAASVSFRFSSHQHSETTAFDKGIFRYWAQDKDGTRKIAMLHFEGLLIKRDGKWLWLMERQMHAATQAQWDALK